MLIAGVIALCIVILILAFLFPKLSQHPQRGSQKAIGLGGRGASKAPGKLGRWLSKPFSTSNQGRLQERLGRPQGPRQAAVLTSGERRINAPNASRRTSSSVRVPSFASASMSVSASSRLQSRVTRVHGRDRLRPELPGAQANHVERGARLQH